MASFTVHTCEIQIPSQSDYAALYKKAGIINAPGGLVSKIRVEPKRSIQKFRLYLLTLLANMHTDDILEAFRNLGRCRVPEPWDIKFLLAWCAEHADSVDGISLVGGLAGTEEKTIYLNATSHYRQLKYSQRVRDWNIDTTFIGYEKSY